MGSQRSISVTVEADRKKGRWGTLRFCPTYPHRPACDWRLRSIQAQICRGGKGRACARAPTIWRIGMTRRLRAIRRPLRLCAPMRSDSTPGLVATDKHHSAPISGSTASATAVAVDRLESLIQPSYLRRRALEVADRIDQRDRACRGPFPRAMRSANPTPATMQKTNSIVPTTSGTTHGPWLGMSVYARRPRARPPSHERQPTIHDALARGGRMPRPHDHPMVAEQIGMR